MNAPESDNLFVPKQTITPTFELYEELTADGFVNMAKASFAQVPSIPDGAMIHDNACGTGAATVAIMGSPDAGKNFAIKATDIDENAVRIYTQHSKDGSWPAEASVMDSNALSFPDDTFSHSIANGLVFVLADDGVEALQEMKRTIKPGGYAIANVWHSIPNMPPIEAAAKATRPPGTPLPRQGLERWYDMQLLKSIYQKAGFEMVTYTQAETYVTTSEINRYANMLWSFIGGTSSAGWLESDEENWDTAIEIIKEELLKTPGAEKVDGGGLKLKFVANIAIGTK